MDSDATVVVSGCIAYDTVLFLDGRISGRSQSGYSSPEMGFLVKQNRFDLGGCAANISYGLRQLGVSPAPLAVVGHDFDRYRDYLKLMDIDLSHVVVEPDEQTPNCTILTDDDGAQITAHYLAAAAHSVEYGIGDCRDVRYAVVAPTDGPAMKRHVREFAEASIPVLFQPGQVVETFSGSDLHELITMTDVLVANEHEATIICERTALDLDELAKLVTAVIVTRGARGSTVIDSLGTTDVAAFRSECVVDPTGCGDAFVAGLVSGILSGLELAEAARMATLVAGLNASCWGAQAYRVTRQQIGSLFEQVYGRSVTSD
jgi:adenosine kinase